MPELVLIQFLTRLCYQNSKFVKLADTSLIVKCLQVEALQKYALDILIKVVKNGFKIEHFETENVLKIIFKNPETCILLLTTIKSPKLPELQLWLKNNKLKICDYNKNEKLQMLIEQVLSL